MFEDGNSAALDYYTRIIEPGDTLSLKFLASNFHRAPANVNEYLQAQCRNVRGLNEFFSSRPDLFFVENKRVSKSDDDLEVARETAEEFFRKKLKEYSNPVHYMTFKQKHIDEATEAVATFIARFYPAEDFKNFFKLRPRYFVVHKDTIFLINVESVRYFVRRLKLSTTNGTLHFMKLRGHTGQAPPHIQTFINTYYGVQDFPNFLWENDDVFKVDDNGNVSLVNNIE